MRTTISFTIIFLISTFQLFGQLYINDSLINYENKYCSSLTIGSYNSEIYKGEFRIKSAEFSDNCLSINFSYGGGCGQVYLRMLFDTSFGFINLPVIHLFPQFIDNDPCEAMRYGNANFDLDVLMKKQKRPFVLKIGEYDKTITVK